MMPVASTEAAAIKHHFGLSSDTEGWLRYSAGPRYDLDDDARHPNQPRDSDDITAMKSGSVMRPGLPGVATATFCAARAAFL